MIKLNLGCGDNKLKGFDNLDKETGWHFENGLKRYKNETVDAITISHALMYVDDKNWPFVFQEFYRVMKPGGVIRITEDNTIHPNSPRRNGHHDAIAMTYPYKLEIHLQRVGFKAVELPPDSTLFYDSSLVQQFHGDPPKVFHIEGIKE